MSKPILRNIPPFDALNNYSLTMSYVGSIPDKNRVIIYDAITLKVLYDQTVTNANFEIEHVIPANTLANGKKYAIQCQVMYTDGTKSSLSDKIYFWCFATPLFYFKDITNDATFNTASLYATLVYEQGDWEDIAEYQFFLYDEVKVQLYQSQKFYYTDYLNHHYTGLEDNRFYYIRAIGATVNGIQMDTGYIRVFVSYENEEEYKLIHAECNEKNSVVTYFTNFVVINPSGGNNDNYEFENGWINLIDKTLVYDKDFIVDGDFTISIRGKDLYRNATILKCSNDEFGFTLSSYIYDDGQMRFRLTVPNGITNLIKYSIPITPDLNDVIGIHIRRINNIYDLECFVELDHEEKYNMWFGEERPTSQLLASYDVWIENGENGVYRVDKDNVNIFYQKDEPMLLAENKYDIWIGDK